MNTKKIILILLVCLFIMGAGYGVYLLLQTNTPSESTAPQKNPDGTTFFPTSSPNTEPIGTNEGEGANNEQNNSNNSDDNVPEIAALLPISEESVSGYTLIETPTGTLARYTEKATGHIFDSDPIIPSPKKIISMTLPRAQKVSFSSDGKRIFYQYTTSNNADVRSYLGQIIAVASSSRIVGDVLPGTFLDAFLTPDTLIVLEKTNTNGVIAKISLDGKKKTPLFSSPIYDLTLRNINNTSFSFLTKPLFGVQGAIFSMNVKDGSFQKNASGVGFSGLISPNGKKVLRGEASTDRIELSVADAGIFINTPLNIKTFPEKCVWAGDSVIVYCFVPQSLPEETALPDAWYQGKVTFRDLLYKIDTLSGVVEFLISKDSPEIFDAEDVSLDPNETFIAFRDKTTGVLWRFLLPEEN